MEHFWQTIEGYFTFPDYYEWVAARASAMRRWHGVEVGVYTGQSAAYLGAQMIRYNSMDPKLDLVDLELTRHRARENLKPLIDAGVIGQMHECDDVAAARRYEDESLDFVFIDTDHSYAGVRRCIDAWLPKVKHGGIVAGHDYTSWGDFGVIKAVTETFPRVDVWRGHKGMGDAQMQPLYWPVWSVQL